MQYVLDRAGAAALSALVLFTMIVTSFAAEGGEEDMVTCSDGFLSVSARDVRGEDLMKEIGECCGIKIIVHGEVFSEVPVSIRFEKLPMRTAIKRILRVTDIPNHLIHFETNDNGTRIAELDLIGKKGGERHLTRGGGSTHSTARRSPPAREPDPEPVPERFPPALDSEETAKIQENFLKIMDKVLKAQLEEGAEPDPGEVLKMFKEAVPEDMKDQIPPEVLEELERLQ